MGRDLTSDEAAKLLGVSSPATVRDWLEGGQFPGAYVGPDGAWRFPPSAVLAMMNYMNELRVKNTLGDMMPVDLGDDYEPPAL